MSLGSRSDALEALLAAKYELEFCEEGEKEDCSKALENSIASALVGHPNVSRYDLLQAIADRYREYKFAKVRAQRRRETL